VDFRDILLVLHIAGAGTWLGANIVHAVAPPLAARQGSAALAGWHRISTGLNSRLYIPASITILVTGILLVLQSNAYGFDSLFVGIGMGMIVVSSVLGIVVFGPGGERAAEAIDSGDDERARSETARLTGFGVLDTLLLLFTMIVMVLRWGA